MTDRIFPFDADADDAPGVDAMTNPVPFLRHWFAGCEGNVQLVAIMPNGGRVETFSVPAPHDWSAVVAWAREQSDVGRNVYFCPVTQRPGTTGHRTEGTAHELPGVFADLDGLDHEHEPWQKIEAKEIVTAAVASSNTGLHVYARFREPVRVTDEDREQLKDVLFAYGAGLNGAVHGDESRKVDRFDLASLMRVPGTVNHPNAKKRKAGREQEPVFVFALPGGAVEPAQLAGWMAAHPRSARSSTSEEKKDFDTADAEAEPGRLPAWWETTLAEDKILRSRFERTQPGPRQTDTSASGFLLSLCNHLARKYRDHISDAEALAVGVAFYQRVSETKDVRAIQRTWRKAKADGMKPDPKDTTDLGNAKRFVHRHGATMRYVYEWKRWRVYDGKRWAADVTGQVDRLAQETAEAMLWEAFELPPDDPTRAERIKRAVGTKTRYRLRAMVELAQPHCAATPDDFDGDPFLVNCQNGTLDLRTGKLRAHDPDDMLTKIVPVAYTPDAPCPLWLAFLHRIFSRNALLIAYVQRALGSALAGKMLEQIFHILHGLGANGKTTLMERVSEAFGDYAKHSAGSTFLMRRNPDEIRGDLNRLKDARLVVASETRSGAVLDDATIKQLTGGDKIVNRDIYQKHEEYESLAHIFLLTNHKPHIVGRDHAIWRRVRLIPFAVTIPPEEQDLALSDKLRDELPGIFAWLVEGALAVQAAEGRLEPPPEVLHAVAAYRTENDLVGQFLSERCVVEPRAMVGAQELYDDFVWWHDATCDESDQPLSYKAFRQLLIDRGLESKRFEAGVHWIGLALRWTIEAWLACFSPECTFANLVRWTQIPEKALAAMLREREEQGEVVVIDGCYGLAPDGREGQRWARLRESAYPTLQ